MYTCIVVLHVYVIFFIEKDCVTSGLNTIPFAYIYFIILELLQQVGPFVVVWSTANNKK